MSPAPGVFYYDLSSPEDYLEAERLRNDAAAEWVPVYRPESGAFRCATERDIYCEGIERRAAELGLQPIRWPEDWPTDSQLAMRAATYAKRIGKGVGFSLAAFRQVFAGGRDLADPDTIYLAGAACEIHPNALGRALESQSVITALEEATAAGRAGRVPGAR